MAHQICCRWHMPYSEISRWIDACCVELPTHINIAATNVYCMNTKTSSDTATESRPTAAVPFGYAVCRHSSCCGEVPTHINIAAANTDCIDLIKRIAHTTSESRPTAAVPFGYVGCRHSSCCVEFPAYV